MAILLTILIFGAAGAAIGAGLCVLLVKGMPFLYADMSMMKYFVLWGLITGLVLALLHILKRKRERKMLQEQLDKEDNSSASFERRKRLLSEQAALVTKTCRNNASGSDSLTPFPEENADAVRTMQAILAGLAENAAHRSALELLCADLTEYDRKTGGNAE